MPEQPKPDAPVVVVVGASSGIGRLTAHEFARRGARLVLAARSESSLQDVVEECRRLGGQAIAVPADVTVEAQVQQLVRAAVREFGWIDVWIGAASAYAYGTVEATPPAVFRRLLETNLTGQLHGIRAVLPQFHQQGRGALILVGSIYSRIGTPYVSAYAASKAGLLRLAEVLRQELHAEKDIHVSVVLPATFDTPIFQHAANYTGHNVKPLPPVGDPKRVARKIVRLAYRPRPTAMVGVLQRGFVPVHDWLPRVYDRFAPALMDRLALGKDDVAPHTGTVFEPRPETNAATGGWRSMTTRLLLAGALTAGAAVVSKTRRRTRAR
ncbi:putative 3-oxoacyl-[acyl-carrier-protein] reductase [Arthrobacter crystallopoietes BAB-32]|uniref:Putative 3-oxoacyl-[acyl-carrier-protein] reductase n=1 Tax=Arthrobacter crystallopoietes BAB-32 TaxID=1246476 RepID=N1V9J1_9MICC|nr:SDR family NAD(P)-dependent oxidoreductase [Arthrobacter crystallopoietes]EMY34943.1 putative 3-oxoacyl-[acyl-carrier-protein] reductase [Arthrobacter crystallopoietes BAB-32]